MSRTATERVTSAACNWVPDSSILLKRYVKPKCRLPINEPMELESIRLISVQTSIRGCAAATT
jgi:hypothetical protein